MSITDKVIEFQSQPEQALEELLNFDKQELTFEQKKEYITLLKDLAEFKQFKSEDIDELKKDGICQDFYQTMVDEHEAISEKLGKHAPEIFLQLAEKYTSDNKNGVLIDLISIMNGLVTCSPDNAAQTYISIPNNNEYDLLKENLMVNCIQNNNHLTEKDMPMISIYLDRSAKKLENACEELNTAFTQEELSEAHIRLGEMHIYEALKEVSDLIINHNKALPTNSKALNVLSANVYLVSAFEGGIENTKPRQMSSYDLYMVLGGKISEFLLDSNLQKSGEFGATQSALYYRAIENIGLNPENFDNMDINKLPIQVKMEGAKLALKDLCKEILPTVHVTDRTFD
jgi:hypothetical protein